MPKRLQNQRNSFYGFPSPFPNPGLPPIKAQRAPTTLDTGYDLGQTWIDEAASQGYVLLNVAGGVATWDSFAGGTSVLSSLTGDTGTAIPSSGNILIAGTANEIETAASGSTVTIGLPAATTVTTSVTSASFITSSATLGTTYTTNTITPTGSNANIDLQVNGKGTGGVIHSRSVAAVDITIEATNSDNTSGSSRAGFEAATGGASSGDPYVNFLVSGAGQFTMGIDNSVSDNFVISTGADLGTTDNVQLTSAGALSVLRGNFDITRSATGNVTATVSNTSVGAGTDNAIVNVSSGGAAGGDAQSSFIVTGATTWSAGVDNSASDAFVIAASGTLGTSNAASWSTAGALTNTGAITATSGAITATNGNFVGGTAGNSLFIPIGANAAAGTDVLINGTVTVNTTACGAASLVFVQHRDVLTSTAIGILEVTPATNSFVVTSLNPTNATTQTNDISTISWWILNPGAV